MKGRGFWAEFQSFAVKGNAFELAIAVVVGNAFTAVVNALVGDVITPLLGLFTNNIDLKNLAFAMGPDLTIKYGDLLQAVIDFFIIALSIFVVFRALTAARKRIFREQDQIPPSEKPAQERLLEEIRDLLKEQIAHK